MQKISDYKLLGTSPVLPPSESAKTRQRGSQGRMDPIPARRLTLAEAESITKTSAPGGVVPRLDPPVAVPPVRAGSAKRDRDNTVVITEKQAEGHLPNGRYRVVDANGRTLSTIEIGSSWCSEGLRLARSRRQIEAAQRRIEKEKSVQDLLFGELR